LPASLSKTHPMSTPLDRRDFLRHTGLAAAGFALAPPWLNAATPDVSPSSKLNVAAIGFGGVGGSNVRNSADENIVALCDLDLKRCAGTIKQFPKADTFTDFRVMLDKRKDIDAVIIATPDHSHAYIAMECMRRGKHVYVQKPIAHNVFEARTLTEAARKHRVVTQMGNQGHSGEGIRQICEWLEAGLIGQVREAHAWTNRPIWPQSSDTPRPTEKATPPDGMDWDLWCGPAPVRPYHPTYHPGKWRAWCDFGTGALGDMGCHIIDPLFLALKLRYPESVEGNVSTGFADFGHKSPVLNECFPRSSIVRYRFPARGDLPPVQPRLLDRDQREAAKKLTKTIPRIPGNNSGHEKDWLRACKGGVPASSNFDYSGPLSEMVLMGNLAIRFPDRKLLWDGEKMQVTNDAKANAFVRRVYRQGFELGT